MLDEDNILGPKTRHELIKAYMELEETTLPPEVGVEIHGCGEYFPVTEDKSDGVESEENRRVELFCFDDKIHPPVPGKKAKKGEPEYPQWKGQVSSTVDTAGDPTLPIHVDVYAPDPLRVALELLNDEGELRLRLPYEEGVRTEDRVTFSIDPEAAPNPATVRVVFGAGTSAEERVLTTTLTFPGAK